MPPAIEQAAGLRPTEIKFAVGRVLRDSLVVLRRNLPTVTYCLLRSEKKGVGIEQIAKVFD